jgi:hypothetical protein
MTDSDASRRETLAGLAQSRDEISRILIPQPAAAAKDEAGGVARAGFPRSRTMKLLVSGRGLGTVGAIAGGLLLARPALALKLFRMLPSGAIARMLMVKAVASLRSKHD